MTTAAETVQHMEPDERVALYLEAFSSRLDREPVRHDSVIWFSTEVNAAEVRDSGRMFRSQPAPRRAFPGQRLLDVTKAVREHVEPQGFSAKGYIEYSYPEKYRDEERIIMPWVRPDRYFHVVELQPKTSHKIRLLGRQMLASLTGKLR